MPPSSLTPETEGLLREYLGLKKVEREKGYTNEQISKLVKTFSENLAAHIQEDRREFAAIHKRLDSHHARIETLEAREPEIKPIPISSRQSLVPPSVTDTGSYKIDPKNWQMVTTFVEELQQEKLVAEGVQKKLQEDSKAAEKKLEAAEKKLEFWMKVGGAIVAVVGAGATLFGWMLHHFH